VVIQSYEGETGSAALLVDTVGTVDWLAACKASEATPDYGLLTLSLRRTRQARQC
jgi:hypothetical protein